MTHTADRIESGITRIAYEELLRDNPVLLAAVSSMAKWGFSELAIYLELKENGAPDLAAHRAALAATYVKKYLATDLTTRGKQP